MASGLYIKSEVRHDHGASWAELRLPSSLQACSYRELQSEGLSGSARFATLPGRRNHALPLLARRIVKRHLVVSTAMGNKRAAESDEEDLRENLAVVRAVHRQAGDKLLGTRGGETKIPQLLGAPHGLARRLHRREQQCCVTDRQDLLRVEQLAEYRS